MTTKAETAVITIHPDNRVAIHPITGTVSATDLCRLIGGPCEAIDVIRLTQAVDMWLDDEGLLNGQQPNMLASIVAAHYRGCDHILHGPAVIAASTPDGGTVGMEPAQVMEFLTALIGIITSA